MAEKNKNDDNVEVKQKKSTGKIIIIIIIAILATGVGTFYATSYILQKNNPNIEKKIEYVYYDIGEMIVNINSEYSDKRYVKCALTVSYDKDTKGLAEEMEEKKSLLVDAGIFYLKSLNDTDFSAANEENLKINLKAKLNEKLEKGEIADIIFTTLQVQ